MILVTAAIIIENDKVLIAKRKTGQKLEGFWEFPGGKIEANETPHSCIERELFEELNVKSKAGKIIAESIYEYPHAVIKLIAIETTLKTNNIQLTVHDEVKWLPLKEVTSINLAPADISIAKKIYRECIS